MRLVSVSQTGKEKMMDAAMLEKCAEYGRRAFSVGIKRKDCPLQPQTIARKAWLRGYV